MVEAVETLLRALGLDPIWIAVVILGLMVLGALWIRWERVLAKRQAEREEESRRAFQRMEEENRRAFELLLRRSDFLHQERGKACMLLLKDIMHAKSFLHHTTTPLQQGVVDHKDLLNQANAACRAFHDHSLEYGFLFSKSLDEKMQSVKRKLWELLDEVGPDILDAVEQGVNPLQNRSVHQVNKRIRTELGPIEDELIAEVRSLLGADLEDEPHSRKIETNRT